MKKISREEQMMKNGGDIKAIHTYAASCTTCNNADASWSGWTRKSVSDKAYAHYKAYHTKKAPHRWVWVKG